MLANAHVGVGPQINDVSVEVSADGYTLTANFVRDNSECSEIILTRGQAFTLIYEIYRHLEFRKTLFRTGGATDTVN